MQNNKYKWLEQIFATNDILAAIRKNIVPTKLGKYLLLTVEPKDWQVLFNILAEYGCRLVSLWAENLEEQFLITAAVEFGGEVLLVSAVAAGSYPQIESITPLFPGANRLERHMRDMFGIHFVGHPDSRRWIRHQAWSEKQYPLRKHFPVKPVSVATTPPDNDYPFLKATGAGIYEIPVGPVHAGIIEPGHFRFQVAGEEIINLEEHLGYVHKGIEKIAEGRDSHGLLKLAGRISGDSTVGYAWATAMACENAVNLAIPPRAAYLRAILCERERVANHLGDMAAIMNDVGFAFAYYQLMRLKEQWLRVNFATFGHRLLMDRIVPGGVMIDLDPKASALLQEQIIGLRKELEELFPVFEANSTLHDRLKTTGVLTQDRARALGVLGYVGRASGLRNDLRVDAPYFPYDQVKIKVPVYKHGDVLARTRVRAQEIFVALNLLEQFLQTLPEGEISLPWLIPDNNTAAGIGMVEGWRGELFVYIAFDSHGLVERYFPRDPSWFAWPALEELIHGNIVPDFPVCNKSINGSYSGVDL